MAELRARLQERFPSASVDAAASALAEAIDGAVARAEEAAQQLLLADGGPVDEAAAAIGALTARVEDASRAVAALADEAAKGFAGSPAEAILAGVRAQVGC
jgi:hypothetical protein